jgi:hypothetical protein
MFTYFWYNPTSRLCSLFFFFLDRYIYQDHCQEVHTRLYMITSFLLEKGVFCRSRAVRAGFFFYETQISWLSVLFSNNQETLFTKNIN